MNDNIKIFKNGFGRLYENTDPRKKRGAQVLESANFSESLSLESYAEDSLLPSDEKEFSIQKPIRDWFDKVDLNNKPIGTHPDFLHLSKTNIAEYHHITTLFLDIMNSTRLALLYDLETVVHIKNTILRGASEVVRALDGHVHRFMGDALMAYFGGKKQKKEDSIMAALSCAAMLQLFMKESVLPNLEAQNVDSEDIGFRIGIDFGDDKEVLWSSYGYTDVHEVTATSLYVDRASKLQSMASKDCVMLGANLINFIDFPFTEIKTRIKDGCKENVEFLKPNLTDKDGVRCDYKIKQLEANKFGCLLPVPTELKSSMFSDVVSKIAGVSFTAIVREGETDDYVPYKSLSRCLKKNCSIRFELRIPKHQLDGYRLPLRGQFIKQNYGAEALSAESLEKEIIHFEISSNKIEILKNYQNVTAYRGLHTLTAEIYDQRNQPIFKDIIGVHIV